MIQLDWTLAVASAVFIFTWLALNRLLFRPFLKITEKRREMTSGVFEDAEVYSHKVEALTESYEQRVKDERQTGFSLAEKRRTEALGNRSSVIEEARGQADALLAAAKQKIDEELVESKRDLKLQSDDLAEAISDQLLGGNRN
jgi:F0F1-type ATP synthase membrane subunit b/b'